MKYLVTIFQKNIPQQYSTEIFDRNIPQNHSYHICHWTNTLVIYDVFISNIKYSEATFNTHFSFKNLLQHITHDKEATVHLLQKYKLLESSVHCPRPLVQGKQSGGCGHLMSLKKTKDSKDLFMWRCWCVHTVKQNDMTYKVKDIKLSIRHNSWLIDTKMTLETVLELIYLWSQGFTHSEVMHELQLSKKNCHRMVHVLQRSMHLCCDAKK